MNNENFTKNDDLYRQLEDAFSEFAKKDRVDYGFLGYAISNDYAVIVPNQPHLYRVVLDDGTYVELPHLGRVPPIPRARVIIKYDDRNLPYIWGLDNQWILQYNKRVAAIANIGLHSHHRGSGMEFPVDWRLLYQLSPQLAQGTRLQLIGGHYYYEGSMYYLPSQVVDYSSFVPTTANAQRWVITAINTLTNPHSIINHAGSLVSTTFLLDVSTITQVNYPSSSLPLFAVRLVTRQNQIYDQDIVSLLHLVGSSGQALNKAQILESIVTDGTYVVLDQNGSVVYV